MGRSAMASTALGQECSVKVLLYGWLGHGEFGGEGSSVTVMPDVRAGPARISPKRFGYGLRRPGQGAAFGCGGLQNRVRYM